MCKIVNILHPTDLSPNAMEALTHAIEMVKTTGARLHILHVAPVFGEDPLRNSFRVSIDEKAFYRQLRNEMDAKVLACLEAYDTNGLDIRRVHSRGGSAAGVILNYIKNNQIDLVVMGTRGHRGIRKLFLGSTALEIVRNAKCDVLTVPFSEKTSGKTNPESILVPIDLTSRSEYVLSKSVALAKLLGLRLDVLHVIESIPVPAWGIERLPLDDLYPYRKAQVREKIEEMVGGFNLKVPYTISTEEGKPSKVVTEYAERAGTELVVLAPHNISWFERMPMGSVTEYILSHSTSPVYTLSIEKTEEDAHEAAAEDEDAMHLHAAV